MPRFASFENAGYRDRRGTRRWGAVRCDITATKRAVKDISASLFVAETFPLEQFRARIKEGEDRDALLTSIRYYTLLRLHELVRGRSPQNSLYGNCR